jgi:CRP-like cAMP-binding protein
VKLVQARPVIDPFLRSLALRDHYLSEDDAKVLSEAISRVAVVGSNEDMVRKDEVLSHSTLILEGWASRYIRLADGRRQILALHIAGAFIDLHSFLLKRMDHSVASITKCKVALFPHAALRRVTEDKAHLTRLLWLSTMVDAAIQRQWLFSTGQRLATERAAHLICELSTRLSLVGVDGPDTFNCPLTQRELGDVLGISNIHANRILQQLRSQGLIAWQDQRVEILDWRGLADLAEFDPTYLNLEDLRR